jgi:hypothetical protein
MAVDSYIVFRAGFNIKSGSIGIIHLSILSLCALCALCG